MENQNTNTVFSVVVIYSTAFNYCVVAELILPVLAIFPGCDLISINTSNGNAEWQFTLFYECIVVDASENTAPQPEHPTLRMEGRPTRDRSGSVLSRSICR